MKIENTTQIAENSQNVAETPGSFNIGNDSRAITRFVAKIIKIERLVTLALARRGDIYEIIKNPGIPGLMA